MICEHLRELYRLCESNELRLSSSDLIRVVCRQCDREDTCPSNLTVPDEEDVEPSASDPGESGQPSSGR